MPLLHHQGKTVFFAHVPKTGGTSVQDYLIRRFGALSMLGRQSQKGPRGTSLINSAQHLSAQDLEEILPADLNWTFAVVRDPIDRALSEYRFQRGSSRVSNFGFSTWLRIMIFAARCEPRIYDNHIRPQADLLPPGTEVFHLEDGLDEIILRLDEIFNEKTPDLNIPHLLKSTNSPIAISREDVALISNFYHADYVRFGYAKPSCDSLSGDRMAKLRNFIAYPLAYLLVIRQRLTWLRA